MTSRVLLRSVCSTTVLQLLPSFATIVTNASIASSDIDINYAEFSLRLCLKIWAFPGIFSDLFFPFSWYIVRLQLINFTLANDDRKQEGRRKSMHRSITYY